MATCRCLSQCNCSLIASDTTTVTGDGSTGNPFIISSTGTFARPSVSVARNITQTISNNTLTAVSFIYEEFDQGNLWDAGQPTRLTFPLAGFWMVGGGARFNAGTTGYRGIYLRENGTTIIAGDEDLTIAGGTDNVDRTIAAGKPFVTGDYIELMVIHTQGADITLLSPAGFPPHAWAVYLGALA